MTVTDDRSTELLADTIQALAGDDLRVVFGPTINFTRGRGVQTAQLQRKHNGRWVKAGPLLLASNDEAPMLLQRVEILQHLAGLLEQGCA